MIRIRSRVPKYSSIQIFVTLLLSLQIIACNNENITQKIADEISAKNVENPGISRYEDISLSWSAPSERENNEPISLSEIAGYKVYYGAERRRYSVSVDIADGSTTNHTFKNLSAGTYYFALTTYDTTGRESQYSTEIVIVV